MTTIPPSPAVPHITTHVTTLDIHTGNVTTARFTTHTLDISIPMSIRFVVQKRRRMNPSFPPKPQPKGRATDASSYSHHASPPFHPPSSILLLELAVQCQKLSDSPTLSSITHQVCR
jgi:hypothetical protein